MNLIKNKFQEHLLKINKNSKKIRNLKKFLVKQAQKESKETLHANHVVAFNSNNLEEQKNLIGEII